MQLRRATLADLATISHWDTQSHVIEAGGEDDWYDWERELPRDVPWREFLIAEREGRPIGFVQIIDAADEETHYWGDCGPGLRAIDIWIGEASDLGRGFGTQIMRLALERCFASPDVEAVLIDPLASNTRAQRFYQRLGFVPIERRMFGSDDTLVHRLDREAWEQVSRE